MTGVVRAPDGEEFVPIGARADTGAASAASSAVSDCSGTVLSIKEDEAFCVSALDGEIDESNVCGTGFYWRDTRFLSRSCLRVNGLTPILLSYSAERAYTSHMDLTNPDVWDGDRLAIAQQTVSIRRIRLIGGVLHERIRVRNYAARPVDVTLEVRVGADFADIFEVRGLRRRSRGVMMTPNVSGARAAFAYLGDDDQLRRTIVRFSPAPDAARLDGEHAVFEFSLSLQAGETRLIGSTVTPLVDEASPEARDYDASLHALRRSYESWERECTSIATDNRIFNGLLDRGRRDMRALLTQTRLGRLVAAGIPWYVAPFGRDGVWAAYEMLALNPGVSASTLRALASMQGAQVDPWRDEEPGKIIHELRQGELAMAGLVPHTPYYGSVDSTPLFLMLAAAYFRWTNDLELMQELRPAMLAALAWMDTYGDVDGDGFIEYDRRSPRGLENQGWKDSGNAIAHTDGTLARGPIALCEVQAYAYMAKVRTGEIMQILGDVETADRLAKEAQVLRERFNEAFWLPDEGFFALALDAAKRPVATVTSNPGHALYCGIVDPEKAEPMAHRLLAPDMFSGWGIRTMSKSAAAYNPMSYHNGSVWPHDNAIIAAGLKRYGFHTAMLRVATAMFETASQAEYLRLPELFCGFTRRNPNRPVSYPVACSPQAWAAAAPFFLVQAMLGLSARADENILTVNKPALPSWLSSVEIRGLRVGSSRVSMLFTRDRDVTSFSVLSRDGGIRVVMEE